MDIGKTLGPEIELADQVVVVQRLGRFAREGDAAVDDDVASIKPLLPPTRSIY
jgi:hypothetical protein